MKLSIYKGFNSSFLESIDDHMLVDTNISDKINVLSFDKKTRKNLEIAFLNMDEDDSVWVTYEEYSLIRTRVNEAIKDDGLEVVVLKNNIYPDYYPLPFTISEELYTEIRKVLNEDITIKESEECKRFIKVYNTLVSIDGNYYSSFYNYEYDKETNITVKEFFESKALIEDSNIQPDYNIFLNDDIYNYLRDLEYIIETGPSIIGVKSSFGSVSKYMESSLQTYCADNNIRLVNSQEPLPEDKLLEDELIKVARNDIGIEGFSSFRKIKFYKNPDIDKEIVELSQGQIIQEIIHQAENSYDESKGHSFRDIFITASTGAGKSVMFQVPAVYLAKKYKKLTIIIEPVKALMQDQKEKLNKTGYMHVEAFNSDLITQVEKENVLKKIKNGDVDLLYLSPETLLSYSIETIIGDREIGLMIIDEAHIVTTWGVGFRPDYWYLGSYINRLRNQIQTSIGMKRKVYNFPICAFTATAINGGIDDSVSDTIISLYMENPIKYIGYVRRDDIKFDISVNEDKTKLSKPDYEAAKTKALNNRIEGWLNNNEKTIVYFPYATFVRDAAKGLKGFAGILTDKRIGTYTGRNINESSRECFNSDKRQMFENFRTGVNTIMFATKAFGMGVDVNDVKNVYHYAVTGNLCDYVQEIGRAARAPSILGTAITDNFKGDFQFMKALFGMSQIKHYQINKVLEGIYNIHKSKGSVRSFLISPESFTYIFNGKGVKDEDKCINKLKTCLLMLEKDFYDKYNFKVIISRPRSVFTKAYVCVAREHEIDVKSSKYGGYFKFIEKGRDHEAQGKGLNISDIGDIYEIDLKGIWEQFYPDLSFPHFKYLYFNVEYSSNTDASIMPEIRPFFSTRQKLNIEVRRGKCLSDLRNLILEDFEHIADVIYENFGKSYFTADDVVKLISKRFGESNGRVIANSLFELVDPNNNCVKCRTNESIGKLSYSLSNGNFKEYMRKCITKSSIIRNITNISGVSSYSSYLRLKADDSSTIALKLLSIFNYINYEVIGGEEPEIFIRLNDPDKVRDIVTGNIYYLNNYVERARKKHSRDIDILSYFFLNLNNDEERWNYIEDYFLGNDVICDHKQYTTLQQKMSKLIVKKHSYKTNMSDMWEDIEDFFDTNDKIYVKKIIEAGINIPEYLQTEIKNSEAGNDILMSWPSKDTLICQMGTSDITLEFFSEHGWLAYRINEIDFDLINERLK